jgi:hypothetical protein
MFDSKALKEIGYDENYSYAEDYHMFLRFIQKYKLTCLQETLYFYRIHPNQSIGIKNKLVQDQNVKKICSYIVNLYWNSKSELDVEFYLKYLRKSETINSATDFIHWNDFLKRLSHSTKLRNFLNNDILVEYIFKNYWLSNFTRYFPKLSYLELVKILNSPFCTMSISSKFKYLVKKLILKNVDPIINVI